MLYFIGLGLGDAEDVTVKGLKIIKRASRVYLEAYTSILTVGKEALEESYGREVVLADRDMVEQQSGWSSTHGTATGNAISTGTRLSEGTEIVCLKNWSIPIVQKG
jgi:diphthamide biosynthesis methyltransferase